MPLFLLFHYSYEKTMKGGKRGGGRKRELIQLIIKEILI